MGSSELIAELSMIESQSASNSVSRTRRKLRLLVALGFLTWLAFLSASIVYLWSWRTLRWEPDYRWAAATVGPMILFGCLTFLVGLIQFLMGPRRIAALTCWMLGTLPLVASAAYFAELYWRAEARQNIHRHWLSNAIAALASDLGDAEVKFRNLRRMDSERFVLIDDGSFQDPSSAMKLMEEHIESMGELLEETPQRRPYWVRHSILGQTGRALFGWAVSDRVTETASELSYLDRHEVAHAFIELLCLPDSAPPAVLVEGWAELQSKSIEAMCRDLIMQLSADNDYPTSVEMVQERWYSRSFGPVYVWGGPLVAYLIETEGGPKFLKLYREADRGSFEQKVAQIYGKSWKQLCTDFDHWMHRRFPDWKFPEEPSPTRGQDLLSKMRLAEGVNAADWEFIRDKLMEDRDSLYPDSFAAKVVTNTASDGNESASVSTVRLAISESELLMTRDAGGYSNAWAATPQLSLFAHKQPGERLRTGCRDDAESFREKIARHIRDWLRETLLWTHPLSVLADNLKSSTEGFVEFLEEDSSKRMWIIQCRFTSAENVSIIRMTVDPELGWRCRQISQFRGQDPTPSVEWNGEYTNLHGFWMPTRVNFQKADGEQRDQRAMHWSVLGEREILSLRDEIMTIPVRQCESDTPLPSWLMALRITIAAWGGLGIVFWILVRLFRI